MLDRPSPKRKLICDTAESAGDDSPAADYGSAGTDTNDVGQTMSLNEVLQLIGKILYCVNHF